MLLQLRLDDVGDGRRSSSAERLAPALLTLMQRTVTQLHEWRADPEALACAELLPPLDEEGSFAEVLLLDGDEDGDDDDDGFSRDDEDDDGGGDGDDEGGGAAANAYGRARRLQVAAENCLAALLDARPTRARRRCSRCCRRARARRPSRSGRSCSATPRTRPSV